VIGLKELYYCNVCGNVLEAVYAGAPALVCYNKLMKKLIANTEDLGKEKQVPVVGSLD
jgi:superoxide reductase